LKVYKKTLKIQSKRECKSKVKKESSWWNKYNVLVLVTD
jgi:hypothetical protein